MSEDTRKMPLWRWWIDNVGVTLKPGDQVTIESLTESLSCARDTWEFRGALIHITKWMETERGLNFTARGQYGKGYIVSNPDKNVEVMKRKQREGFGRIKRAVALGIATPLHAMTEEQKRVHIAYTERTAGEFALLSKYMPVQKVKEIK